MILSENKKGISLHPSQVANEDLLHGFDSTMALHFFDIALKIFFENKMNRKYEGAVRTDNHRMRQKQINIPTFPSFQWSWLFPITE
jgi:hypothetical protein